jgi:hypothetical protein
MINLLAGDLSRDHKDWNNDNQITDPGDGFGFLLNGDQLGYIQAVYSHADYAVNASGASRNMIVSGENAKVCTQNLARWAPELRDQLLAILNASSLAEMESAVKRSAALADQMLSGIDLNENGSVEPLAAECGVVAAYEAIYRMADMPLLPVNPFDTPTAGAGSATPLQTATPTLSTVVSPTARLHVSPTDRPPVIATQPPGQPTSPPPPQATKKPRPTQKPKPTKKP